MFEAMNEFGVDTLKAARALEAAGFEAAQAETLVAVFHGFAVGHGATREQVRDLESTLKTETTALHGKIETETAALHAKIESEIRNLRTEFDGKIEELRTEVNGKIEELRTEVTGEIAKLHLSVEGLKTRMYQLLLGQVVLIVGLIVSLDRLL